MYKVTVTSSDEQEIATGFLEDMLLDVERMIPRHSVRWPEDNCVEIATGANPDEGDAWAILDWLLWAAKIIALESYYGVRVEGEGTLIYRREEIRRQRQ